MREKNHDYGDLNCGDFLAGGTLVGSPVDPGVLAGETALFEVNCDLGELGVNIIL